MGPSLFGSLFGVSPATRAAFFHGAIQVRIAAYLPTNQIAGVHS